MPKINRKIPATMATQHPDHSSKPYWHNQAFIPTLEETKECFLCFSELGIDEYKWDWEGKLVDEAVMERLVASHHAYFAKLPLGEKKFLTFRLPNPKVEAEFRLSRALMGILTASGLAKQLKMHTPPMFEVILPMTESAEEMLSIQEAFAEISNLKHPLNKIESNGQMFLEVIPLFESVSTIINSSAILERYLRLFKEQFKKQPAYLRPYVARSDPALNSGIVPTVLAIKIALSRFAKLSRQHNLPLYPVIGAGSLPFRGGLSPLSVSDFVKEYKGIRTVTIQSAFRYDYSKKQVIKAIQYLNQNLPKGQAQNISKANEERLIKVIPLLEKPYQGSIEHLAPLINKLNSHLPQRRERVQHVGLFGYSRGIGKVKLPRAINFTGTLYSLGIPPELIGTGRGLNAIAKLEHLSLLKKYCVNLESDLKKAGQFLYKPGLIALAKKNQKFQSILEDVREIEKHLAVNLGPKTRQAKQHYKLAAHIHEYLDSKKSLTKLIEAQAMLRHSMG